MNNNFIDLISSKTHVGYSRKKNEDSILISNYRENSNNIILAVADGMNNLYNDDDKVSEFVLNELNKWYNNLDYNIINNDKLLLTYCCKFIDYLDWLVRDNYLPQGTTLSISFINEDSTLFVNCGDSRIYIYDNKCINQVSTDHKVSYILDKYNYFGTKESVLFHPSNNILLSRLGCNNKMLIINHIIIKNPNYNGILMFSDGITNLLTNDDIYNIVKKDDSCANDFVERALTEYKTNYEDKIDCDNLSAICYKRRR